MNHYECANLFGASKSLLEGSGLVRYSNDTFVSNSDEEGLERCWRENFDQDFGRYMAWVWFSVSAENLVKAALVCNELLEQKPENSRYPFYWRDTDKGEWVERVLQSRLGPGGEYPTLGPIWKEKLDKLCQERRIAEAERRELKAAYKYLTQAIRNRDAHSYKKNERRKDFPVVESIFVPAFKTLVHAIRDKGHFNATGL